MAARDAAACSYHAHHCSLSSVLRTTPDGMQIYKYQYRTTDNGIRRVLP